MEDDLEGIRLLYFIQCDSCNAMGPSISGGPIAAGAAWNCRSSTPIQGLARADRGSLFGSNARKIRLPEARPCPFCGHASAFRDGAVMPVPLAMVLCDHCESTGPDCDDAEDALVRWNGRSR